MPGTPADEAPIPLPINGAGNGGAVIAEANGVDMNGNPISAGPNNSEDED